MVAIHTKNDLGANPFAETFKNAYSHGLEQIYALETVDITKVKRIEESLPTLKEEEPVVRENFWDGHYRLDLGDEHRPWIKPVFLDEPIQVLGLSQKTELALSENGKKRLRDIVHADLKEFISLKGIGQGHIDEIQKKLKQYIAGRSLDRSFYAEFAPLIRGLTVNIERKQAFFLLESYQLDSLISMNAAERMEVLLYKPEAKKGMVEKALEAFKNPEKVEKVFQFLKQVSQVFLIPWMRGRNGIARKSEIEERLAKICDQPEMAKLCIKFINEVYTNGEFPFKYGLIEIESGLFCSDPYLQNAFDKICDKALSYFYKPEISYQLSELAGFLSKEFGTSWETYEEGLLTAALRSSAKFKVRKDSKGRFLVKRDFAKCTHRINCME